MLTDISFLILEDHAFQAAYLHGLLEDAGFHKVEVTFSADDALEKIKAKTFDVVLVDLNMPDVDGVQFIHAVAALKDKPLVVITSGCSPKIVSSVGLMAREKGLIVVDTFIKPITREKIQSLIESLLKLRSSEAKARNAPPVVQMDFDQGALVSALASGQIHAWFQPKMSLKTGIIEGAEALARWVHPELGFISPGAFLGAIKNAGLERALLLRILDDALSAYSVWRSAGHLIPISVNLPTKLLDDPGLPDEIFGIVSRTDVPVEDITLELLEDETTSQPGQYNMGVSRLRLKGLGLAQDDFGIGYSSMQSLISTPFTELKIDRAFVDGAATDPERRAAMESTVRLGKQLGLSITAEGVETLLDVEFLRDIGCDYIQGYVVSAAVNVHTFTELLSGHVLINPGLDILKSKTEPLQALSATDTQDHPTGRK